MLTNKTHPYTSYLINKCLIDFMSWQAIKNDQLVFVQFKLEQLNVRANQMATANFETYSFVSI